MEFLMDIRQMYLDYFHAKGHKICDSMPLVPDDASLLFTNAGMVQFKDIFTGKIPIPTPPRATSSQLCIRAGGKHNDLENVGYTARHHTLFEMLGNFSFGDYFKKDAIGFAWEFVTKTLGFDKSLLYVTIHESDDEAYHLWCEHIDSSRIKRMGDKDNFWQMGDSGPCGPCSEIYVDQGEKYFHSDEDYFGGEGDRFLEIWNLVFMQYEQKDGKRTPLPKPSIDTGMGLERVIALLEGKINNFDTSLFAPLMDSIAKLTGKTYYHDNDVLDNVMNANAESLAIIKHTQASFRVIADHARSVAFLLAQGVHFDKEGRGYVLRRILRRAVRHGYLLGLKRAFLYEVVGAVCESMGRHYGYLLERKNAIMEQCRLEEERFYETIESGMELFNRELENLLANSCKNIQAINSKNLDSDNQKQNIHTLDSRHSENSLDSRHSKSYHSESSINHRESSLCHSERSEESLHTDSKDISHSLNMTDSKKAIQTNTQDMRINNQQGGSILSEKCGLQENAQGSYLSGNDRSAFSQFPHLSPKDNATNTNCTTTQAEVSLSNFEGCADSSDEIEHERSSRKQESNLLQKCQRDNATKILFSGAIAFRLYDTYGFPLDLTQDMLRDKGLEVDMQAFEECMSEQKSRSKASWKGSGDAITQGDFKELLSTFGINSFVGYTHTQTESKILALLDSSFKRIDMLQAGMIGYVLLDSTPFYPEGGGPIGDKGVLRDGANIIAKVVDTKKYFGLNISTIQCEQNLKANAKLIAEVDSNLRLEIAKHHSATHLLHFALRQILGTHIAQAGSLVESNRLRFDFSHPKALNNEEILSIQNLVNAQILACSPQVCENMSINDAKAKGAMALFGEKYGENVRVISFGDSIELCGGIHIENTAFIGNFYITKESGVSSGVRRIEAVCGKAGYEYTKESLQILENAREILKTKEIITGITKLQSHIKELKNSTPKATQNLKSLNFEQINGTKLLVMQENNSDIKALIDNAKNEYDKIAILLLSEIDGKITIAAGVKNAPIKAGAWVKQVAQILGGNGGGRDDFATAGGKEVSKINEAIKLAKNIAKEALQG